VYVVLKGESGRDDRRRIGPDIAEGYIDVLALQCCEDLEPPQADRLVVGHNLLGGHEATRLDIQVRCPFGGQASRIRQL